VLIARRAWESLSFCQVAHSIRSSASLRLPLGRLGFSRRCDNLRYCVLHRSVEQRLAGGEVHVDGGAHHASAASDLGHDKSVRDLSDCGLKRLVQAMS
jgi:hypothetical protein